MIACDLVDEPCIMRLFMRTRYSKTSKTEILRNQTEKQKIYKSFSLVNNEIYETKILNHYISMCLKPMVMNMMILSAYFVIGLQVRSMNLAKTP